ncbi:glycerophosphodiester phosphodiesterase family protein [Saccharomonospora cyanea]|uniref:Glycerophosphoryl diester phosphodiesterase n=1 Tax=Saccharomonospora cyanea NA-134 TaxID=882082 RepID=H5XF91_9PSEU|nr:glycerophosphodiester phosphodiesterase family protein [Saccharomonospora cyanea]EHR61501.1 glycerophosphoryl diester phosphodiesterase [Saccharomonospora cyanea NA-134]
MLRKARSLVPAALLLLTMPFVAPAAHAERAPKWSQLVATLHDHSADAPLMIAAHRAQWRQAPENSIAAIEAAIADGAEIVELDIMRTKDGHLVLMHDTTVDRTTNGTGAVADLTLAQIKNLRLKKGLGGAQAPLTDHRVPTLEEALEVLRGRAFVNLDKGWTIREDIYRVLARTDTVDHGLFKSSAPVAEVDTFRKAHPDALYMHVVGDANAASIGAFAEDPVAYEITFDEVTDAQVQPEALAEVRRTSRVWINSMWESLAAGMTDESSLRDEDLGWKRLVDEFGASMIQTDNIEALDYWRDGGNLDRYGFLPGRDRTIRIQGEDYVTGGEGVAYHDTDPNRCTIMRLDEGVDICSNRGAVGVNWIRGGEWIRYQVEVPKTGRYRVSARVSSPYSPAGTVVLEWDGKAGVPHEIGNTTHHGAFELQPLETRHLRAGTHDLVVRMPEGFQNFNIDYLQLDRGVRPVGR